MTGPFEMPAPQVPDHVLLRCIGTGSYGEVWLAQNVMRTYRAVKVVYRQNFEDRRPYEREYEGIQKFEPVSRTHEGLVDILQVGRNDPAGYFYYVMELADDVETGEPGRSVRQGLTMSCQVSNPKPVRHVRTHSSHESVRSLSRALSARSRKAVQRTKRRCPLDRDRQCRICRAAKVAILLHAGNAAVRTRLRKYPPQQAMRVTAHRAVYVTNKRQDVRAIRTRQLAVFPSLAVSGALNVC